MTGQNSSFECNDWITTGIEVQVKESAVNSYYNKVVYAKRSEANVEYEDSVLPISLGLHIVAECFRLHFLSFEIMLFTPFHIY